MPSDYRRDVQYERGRDSKANPLSLFDLDEYVVTFDCDNCLSMQDDWPEVEVRQAVVRYTAPNGDSFRLCPACVQVFRGHHLIDSEGEMKTL